MTVELPSDDARSVLARRRRPLAPALLCDMFIRGTQWKRSSMKRSDREVCFFSRCSWWALSMLYREETCKVRIETH